MRSSTILALLGASLIIATPFNHDHDRLHKKAIVYDIETDIVYVTVTQIAAPAPAPTTVHLQSTVIVTAGESESIISSIVKPVYTPKKMTSSSTSVAPVPTTSSQSSTPPAPTINNEAPAPTSEAPSSTTETSAPAASSSSSAVELAPTASAKAVEAVSTSADSFISTGVDKHNSCRSSHSAVDVAWNETLAGYAAITAKTCVFAHDMTEGGGGYGQNIASQGSSSATAWTAESALENAIIAEWYSEASMFTSLYGKESPSGGGDWLHFTQIIWKNSLEIGCAVQACPTNNAIFPGMYTWYTVCNYWPQGNILGEFAENVLAS